MTINGPAAIIWAMYIAAAEKQGVATEQAARHASRTTSSRSTSPRRSSSSRREPSMKLVVDTIEFGTPSTCRSGTPSRISRLPHPRGRLHRGPGTGLHAAPTASPTSRPAIARRPGRGRVRAAALLLLQLAPRLLRGDRQVPRRPAHLGPAHARALRRQEPALVAAALPHPDRGLHPDGPAAATTTSCARPSRPWPAVLGGTQSLHTNSMDETLALPTEKAVQHRAAHPADHRPRDRRRQHHRPAGRLLLRGGLTDRHGSRAPRSTSSSIEALGGVVQAIEDGFFQREIADAAHRYQQALERKQRIVVGVNEYVDPGEKQDIPLLRDRRGDGRGPGRRACDAARGARQRRRAHGAASASRRRRAAGENLMPPFIEAVRCYTTLGEIIDDAQDGVRRVHRADHHLTGGAEVERKIRVLVGEDRPRRPRPRREGRRAGAARRRHGGHLHRPAPDARDDRRGRRPGGRRRGRPLHALRRPHDALPGRPRGTAQARRRATSCSPAAAPSTTRTWPSCGPWASASSSAPAPARRPSSSTSARRLAGVELGPSGLCQTPTCAISSTHRALPARPKERPDQPAVMPQRCSQVMPPWPV